MARVKEDYRSLTGMQKAAIFMLAVGSQHSAQLFEKMDDEEIRELSQAMSSLGTVSATVVERLFVEFADQLSSAGGLGFSMPFDRRQLAVPSPSTWKRSTGFSIRTRL